MLPGPGLKTLTRLEAAGEAPFDLVFIDADKTSNPDYFSWALRLTRPGALIVVDNVVREGAVADAGSDDPAALGVRRLLDLVGAEPRVQTVGTKGYDGFPLARVMGYEAAKK